ncbi:MAG: acetyl-CoA carboxylase biotin carboxyl carrier protein [Deltaproteobacteria bacterium]|nr:acetyl-CoA carboxylase biotin carboxyl carrier protein [Deltaproteobacteria bacterium]
MDVDLRKLRALLRTLAEGGVSEFELEDEQVRMRLVRPAPSGAASLSPSLPVASLPALAGAAPAAAPAEDPDVAVVTSPFVGTFYRAPSPDAPPFVELGSQVKEGQTVCIVEAMKLMNEIEADCAGAVAAILIEDGKPVEFGQALFRIRRR